MAQNGDAVCQHISCATPNLNGFMGFGRAWKPVVEDFVKQYNALFRGLFVQTDFGDATDPDALVDTRRRGVEFSMDSDRPGMLIRKQLMELLARHGEQEIHAGA